MAASSPSTAFEIVGPEISRATQNAQVALESGLGFLDSLEKSVANIINIPPLALSVPDLEFTLPTIGDHVVPDLPLLSFSDEVIPPPPTIQNIIFSDPGAVPSLTATLPQINLPSPPSLLNANFNIPAPDLNVSVVFPDDPNISLPTVPTLEQLNIPAAPSVSLPTIEDLTLPTFDTPVPGNIFQYTDPGFDQTKLDTVCSNLLDIITNGKLGLPVAAEEAIFNRSKDRELEEHKATVVEIERAAASKGFSRPPGALQASLDKAVLSNKLKLQELSRDIAIKQYEMLNENFKFAVQQVVAYEQLSFTIYNQIQERTLEVQKYIQGLAIDLFNVAVNKVKIELQIYTTYYTAALQRIEIAFGELDKYRRLLEAEGLKSGINTQLIEIYKSQLDAAMVEVNIFKNQVDAINTKLNTQKLLLDNFKARVDAEATKVEANVAQTSAYSNLIQGEKLKLDTYNSEVDAFSKRVQAYATVVDAAKAEVDAKAIVNRQNLEVYKSRLDAITSRISAQTQENSQKLEAYKSQLEAVNLGIRKDTLLGQMIVSNNEAANKVLLTQTQLANETAKYNIEQIRFKNDVLTKILQSGAEVSAGLARASLSALNIGASLAGTGATNYNYKISAKSSSTF